MKVTVMVNLDHTFEYESLEDELQDGVAYDMLQEELANFPKTITVRNWDWKVNK